MTIEEMRAELEAAGYVFTTNYKHPASANLWLFEVRSADGWIFRDSGHYAADEVDNARMKEDVVKQAYEHLQKERQFEAMKALIGELRAVLSHCLMVLKRTMYTETPNDIEAAIDRAEKILYKKNNEL
jgi:hypothetical protein